jgi:hypothetical protein
VYEALLLMVPGLEERLMNSGEDNMGSITDLVCLVHEFIKLSTTYLISCPKIQKGVSSARSDDTKSLKGPILDWITPRGQLLNPPLGRNIKMDRGFHHERTGALLCPAGLDWANTE